MKLMIKPALLEGALKIAAKQYYADADACGKAGDYRTAGAFLSYAQSCEKLAHEVDGDAFILIDTFVGLIRNESVRDVEKLVQRDSETLICKNCKVVQAKHIEGAKCPFDTTLFQQKDRL